MATFCFYNSSGSDDCSSNGSSSSSNTSQLPEQPLLMSWEYLTPPELENKPCNSVIGYRPPTIVRSRKSEFVFKKEEKNAKERDRVKRLNELYLTLRSILGGESRDSKLSKVPVLHAAIKYLKDLSKELDRLRARTPKIIRPPPALPAPAALYYQSPDALVEASATHQHQIIHQYSCTCELTLSASSRVILDCTEVYDEALNSDTNDSPPIVNSVPLQTNFVSPTPIQEMAHFYFYSPPPPMLSHAMNTSEVELTAHPWAISPRSTQGLSHPPPPPLSHFSYNHS